MDPVCSVGLAYPRLRSVGLINKNNPFPTSSLLALTNPPSLLQGFLNRLVLVAHDRPRHPSHFEVASIYLWLYRLSLRVLSERFTTNRGNGRQELLAAMNQCVDE